MLGLGFAGGGPGEWTRGDTGVRGGFGEAIEERGERGETDNGDFTGVMGDFGDAVEERRETDNGDFKVGVDIPEGMTVQGEEGDNGLSVPGVLEDCRELGWADSRWLKIM